MRKICLALILSSALSAHAKTEFGKLDGAAYGRIRGRGGCDHSSGSWLLPWWFHREELRCKALAVALEQRPHALRIR